MSRNVTIEDIARQAGVSTSTVSRVLNGTTPVAAEKREAVLAVIERMHYRPSAIAQGLKRGRTAAVGVLTQSIASPYYGHLLLGIESGLAGSEYHAVIASGNWRSEQELAAIDMLAARRVDALIVLAGLTPDEHLVRLAQQLPLVVVGRTVPGIAAQCLRVDDVGAAHGAVRYLLGLGHRRIAHIGGSPSHQDALDRRAGYERALAEAGVEPDPQLVAEGDYTEQSGLLALQALLARGAPFSAIFAANDQMAYGARLGLYRHALRVPEDVSLVGFDDQPGSAYTTPPLTTVRQPTVAMGAAAAAAVLHLLDGRAPDWPAVSTELVIRESAARHEASYGSSASPR